jgi:hypothetical protein
MLYIACRLVSGLSRDEMTSDESMKEGRDRATARLLGVGEDCSEAVVAGSGEGQVLAGREEKRGGVAPSSLTL